MGTRAGFYAENLLSYSHQAKEEGSLPLPVGKDHKFAPVSLGVSTAERHTSPFPMTGSNR